MGRRDQVEIDYYKLIGRLHERRDEYKKEHRAIVIEYRNMVNDYEKKLKMISELFRELFGPSVLVHVKTELSNRRFHLAWNKINEIYDSERPTTLKTSFTNVIL
jgi:hypothetical protein